MNYRDLLINIITKMEDCHMERLYKLAEYLYLRGHLS